jgi:hypothetical protein
MDVWGRRSINQCAARQAYWEPGGRAGHGRAQRPAAAPCLSEDEAAGDAPAPCRRAPDDWGVQSLAPIPRQDALAVVPGASERDACLSGGEACEVVGHKRQRGECGAARVVCCYSPMLQGERVCLAVRVHWL